MNEVIENALNRGVPIATPIVFDMDEFLVLFDLDEIEYDYISSSRELIRQVSKIVDVYGLGCLYSDLVKITMTDNNTKEFRFSESNFYLTVTYVLNGLSPAVINSVINNPEEFENIKKQILEIQNPEELKKNFPNIYKLYTRKIEDNKDLFFTERILKDKNSSVRAKLQELSRLENNLKTYYADFDLEREIKFAKNFTLTSFLERLMNAFGNMLKYSEEIANIYNSNTMDIKHFNKEDEERLNLFIAAKFMDYIETSEHKQRYLFYLTNYFKENIEINFSRVKIRLNEKKVTPTLLYERYKKVLAENPDLLAVNFSYTDFNEMTKEEVEEFITEYLAELSANWELLPEDDTSIEETVKGIARQQAVDLSEEERKKREEKFLDLYMRKKKFYDDTDPYYRIKGKQTFDGYVGYIYSNGLVVLDKFYENAEKKKFSKYDAIYILNMHDFHELSQHSKSYLMSSPLCKRIIHRGLWEDKVLAYINKKDVSLTLTKDLEKLISENKVTVSEKKL